MNIPIIDNMKHPIDQQQSAEQTILLNAIRNKFANNENNCGTSPPVFSIPSLKIPQFTPNSSPSDSNDKPPPTKLNQFILGKLGESPMNGGTFKIPDLKIKNEFDGQSSLTLTEKLRLSSTNSSEIKVSSLNKDISNLHLCDDKQNNHVIDLTTALNQNKILPASTMKQVTTTKPPPNPIDFQIPFIDCDLKEETLKLPLRDDYCLSDVSSFVHRRFITTPSRFGKITCLKYRFPKASKYVDHSFAKKHKITRFGFDTKSPDDIILANLRRHNRV